MLDNFQPHNMQRSLLFSFYQGSINDCHGFLWTLPSDFPQQHNKMVEKNACSHSWLPIWFDIVMTLTSVNNMHDHLLLSWQQNHLLPWILKPVSIYISSHSLTSSSSQSINSPSSSTISFWVFFLWNRKSMCSHSYWFQIVLKLI